MEKHRTSSTLTFAREPFYKVYTVYQNNPSSVEFSVRTNQPGYKLAAHISIFGVAGARTQKDGPCQQHH